MRGGIGEAIGHGTIRTVDDTGATGVLDARHGLLSGIHSLGQEAASGPGLVSRGLTVDLDKV